MTNEIIIIICLLLISTAWLSWWFLKKTKITNKLIEEEFENNINNLGNIANHVNDISELLETYKKVVEEKNTELQFYKEGASNAKHRALYLSLIDIFDFTKGIDLQDQKDEKTKNYLLAVQDKIEILLKSSGVEEYMPKIGKNIMDEKGCTASLQTVSTNDPKKENCINKVLKPGYYIVLDEKNSIHLKDALVEIFKLNKDV